MLEGNNALKTNPFIIVSEFIHLNIQTQVQKKQKKRHRQEIDKTYL